MYSRIARHLYGTDRRWRIKGLGASIQNLHFSMGVEWIHYGGVAAFAVGLDWLSFFHSLLGVSTPMAMRHVNKSR